jgi:hypothetical protein
MLLPKRRVDRKDPELLTTVLFRHTHETGA